MGDANESSQEQDMGRYLESLDSVRFRENNSNSSYAHAKIELLISLLYGRTIQIGDNQFLDSDGFILNVVNLLESQEKMRGLIGTADYEKISSIFPFRLGIRDSYSSLDDFILKKLGDTTYVLSKWDNLQNNPEERIIIAKEYKEGLSG